MSSPNPFAQFNLPAPLTAALARANYAAPTPIQEATLPFTLQGSDILASSQTGSGKTAAFLIPLLTHLLEDKQHRALILAPTRELAVQINTVARQWLSSAHLKTAILVGGQPFSIQLRDLRRQPQLIVGTPGRTLDHVQRGTLQVNNVSFMVLDEADRMLDMGFSKELNAIVKQLSTQRQTLMFSATISQSITKIAHTYLQNPERVAIGSTEKPAANVQQEERHVTGGNKFDTLAQILEEQKGSIIIFARTKAGTKKLAERISEQTESSVSCIHGDLTQRKRDRVLQGFRKQDYRILVATDVASRGLDVDHIQCVINYDKAGSPEDHIHRIGRTGRAGKKGCAINFISPDDNKLRKNRSRSRRRFRY
jgi:ATP-dependent RNA helicase DeaD